MTKKKSEIVYPEGDERGLSREELNTNRINELIRRVDKIATDLYTSDSEFALKKIPEIEKRIDNLVRHLAMNDADIHTVKEELSSLKRKK